MKDLGTTLGGVAYSLYNTNETANTDTANLSNATYQNRQQYLLAWTKQSGSHLPSAFNAISSGNAGTGTGEYELACSAMTDSDQTASERIWLSSVGSTSGDYWARNARVVGGSGCGSQSTIHTGGRYGNVSARFVVR